MTDQQYFITEPSTASDFYEAVRELERQDINQPQLVVRAQPVSSDFDHHRGVEPREREFTLTLSFQSYNPDHRFFVALIGDSLVKITKDESENKMTFVLSEG